MEKKRNSLKILLLLVIVIAAAVVLYNFLGSRTEHSSIGKSSSPAVDFTVTDQQGNSVSLSDMKGRPVIINFWASWCSPCRSEMPHFDKMYKEYGNEIQFMMVNLTGDSETVDTASSYIESEGYSFPVYYDTDGEGASAYSVYSIPATYFIDAEGNIVSQAQGALDESTLQKAIDQLLQKSAPICQNTGASFPGGKSVQFTSVLLRIAAGRFLIVRKTGSSPNIRFNPYINIRHRASTAGVTRNSSPKVPICES